jgi:hypothetical protein
VVSIENAVTFDWENRDTIGFPGAIGGVSLLDDAAWSNWDRLLGALRFARVLGPRREAKVGSGSGPFERSSAQR